jgi:hypothetical protein
VLTEEKPPLLENYRNLELNTSPDKVNVILEKYKDDIENNRPVERNYHW